MATDLNTLKNWFKTGLKPSQEQFWAWMDSFWHKNDKIPQSQIEGLDKSLENKAETSSVEVKANADASELSAENVKKWKTLLGVGELPSNLATIDEGAVLGNVHTKEQVTRLLENSGKNISNTDLIVPAGTVRELDLTGAKLQIKGLEDKGNDASFNKKIITNGRDIAVKEDGDIILQVPNQLDITGSVNVIYPSGPPDVPAYISDLQEIFRQYRAINLDPIPKDEWEIKTFENQNLENNRVYDNNAYSLAASGFTNAPVNMDLVEMTTKNMVLPANKNWIFKIVGSAVDYYHGGSFFAGLTRDKEEPIFIGIKGGGYDSLTYIKETKPYYFLRQNNTFIFIKVGNIISIICNLLSNSKGFPATEISLNAIPELGDFIPKIHLKAGATATGKMFYKILD